MTDTVRDFLRRHLTALGAVVEDEEAALHALLPADAGASAGVEEVLLAVDGPPAGSAIDARLGSPFLEQAVAARRARVVLAAVALPGELPRRLPDHVPVLLNAVPGGAVGPRTRAPARYLAAHLRARLQGDEVRHALLGLTVRLEDGARVPPLDLTRSYPIAAAALTSAEHAHAARALRTATLRAAPKALAGALAAIARRARRDLMRLGDYYASLDAEMAQAVARARSYDERGRRAAKRAMLPDELQARRSQLGERLSARLGAELVAATIVDTEVDRYAIPVRRRSSVGTIALQQRAADGVIEGPSCAGCSLATIRFHLCDERLHALCDECGHAGRLDPARCPGCKPPRPAPLTVTVEDATAALALGVGRSSEPIALRDRELVTQPRKR
ncbi:MAG: hypothetical protein IT293_18245 [Deltaproteobacteria bacterium]|nr:hypothetical protein [Deltaproteobacteria bacterium]